MKFLLFSDPHTDTSAAARMAGKTPVINAGPGGILFEIPAALT